MKKVLIGSNYQGMHNKNFGADAFSSMIIQILWLSD
jgi:hypothetical protein